MLSFFWYSITRFLRTHRRWRVWTGMSTGMSTGALGSALLTGLSGKDAMPEITLVIVVTAGLALTLDYFAWRYRK